MLKFCEGFFSFMMIGIQISPVQAVDAYKNKLSLFYFLGKAEELILFGRVLFMRKCVWPSLDYTFQVCANTSQGIFEPKKLLKWSLLSYSFIFKQGFLFILA